MSNLTFTLAWRDLRAHPGRFVLALFMFALPLFIIMGGATMATNSNSDYFDVFGISEPDKDTVVALQTADMIARGPSGLVATRLNSMDPTDEHPLEPFTSQEVAPALVEGSAELTPGGILLNQNFARAAGVGVGDTLHVTAISGDSVDLTLTVTGIVKGAGAAVLKDSVPPLTGDHVWWETPIPAQRFLVMDGSTSTDMFPWIVLMLVLAVALTAPVFRIGVEQLRHALATAAINGAYPRQLRSIAIWQGLICSALGCLIGSVLAIAVAAIWLFAEEGHGLYGFPLDVMVVFSLLVIASGVCSAWLQSLRFDSTEKLLHPQAHDSHVKMRWWWFVGPVLCVIGAITGIFYFFSIVIGVILSGPLMLYLLTRLPLPFIARLSTAITPRSGLAAGGVAGLILLSIFGNSMEHNVDNMTFELGAPSEIVRVYPDITTTNDQSLAVGAHELISRANPEKVADLYSVFSAPNDGESTWFFYRVGSHYLVASPEATDILQFSDEAKEAISSGMAVQFGSGTGETTLHVPTPTGPSVALPAVILEDRRFFGTVVIPLDTAREAGLPLAYEGTVGSKQGNLTPKEYRDFVVNNSSDDGLTTETITESGFPFPLLVPFLGFALISTVFMVVLLIALSASHTLRDRKLLVSLGAPPRLVRRFGAYQGLMVSTAGALLAAIGGTVLEWKMLAWGHSWLVVVAVPIIGAATGWLVSRPVNPALSRRTEEVVH